MKLIGTKKDLMNYWHSLAESKNALAESLPLMKNGKRPKETLIALAEANVYKMCISQLKVLEEQNKN